MDKYDDVIGPQVITSAFIEKDGKFLLFFCPTFKKWRVPGGRVEKPDKSEETLIREMEEEIGLKIENPVFLGYGEDNEYSVVKKKKTSRLILYFHVKIDKEPTIDSGEAEEFKWLTFDELKDHEAIEGALVDFFNKNPDLRL